jgi:hypothetical protein
MPRREGCVKLDICNTSVLLSLTVVPIPVFARSNIHGTPKEGLESLIERHGVWLAANQGVLCE